MKRLLLSVLALFMAMPTAASAVAITSVSVTPTISTSAFTAGYVLGGIESFTIPSTGGLIQGVISNFNTGAYVGGVDWLFFSANPTGGGTTGHAALAITATDQPNLIGVIHATDCKLTATVTSYCQSGNSPQSIVVPGTTVWVVKQVLGAPTFTNATDDTDTLLLLQ
jgi:hypothetical protein